MKRKVLMACMDIALKNNTPEKHPEWGNYHHFSFFVQRNQIVEWSTNRSGNPITSRGYADWQKIHAEFDVWRKAKGIMDHSLPFEIVNIRLTKTNMIKSSCPCTCCYNFLRNMGCRRIFFTTDNGLFSEVINA